MHDKFLNPLKLQINILIHLYSIGVTVRYIIMSALIDKDSIAINLYIVFVKNFRVLQKHVLYGWLNMYCTVSFFVCMAYIHF